MFTRFSSCRHLPGGTLGFVLFSLFSSAWAADIVVTRFDDVRAPHEGVTLRDAVILANTSLDVPDIILLSAGPPYTITGAIDEDLSHSGDLDVAAGSGLLTIRGVLDASGHPLSIIDADASGDRILHVLAGASADVQGVAMQHGGHNPAMAFAGAVFVDVGGSLTMTDCEVRDNGGPGIAGPGIRNDGTLVLRRCTVTRNKTPDECCGGIDARGNTTIQDSTISDNEAGGCDGGGICLDEGSLVVHNSSISGNSALFAGGGIAVFGGRATISHSTISGNTVIGDGGGIYVQSLFGPAFLDLSSTTVSDNKALVFGDPDYERAKQSRRTPPMRGSFGGTGGGVYADGGVVTLRSSTIYSNAAYYGGGGMYLQDPDDGQFDYSAFNSLISDCSSEAALFLIGKNFVGDTSNCVLTGNDSASSGLMSGMNPRLGPLQDNGGLHSPHTKTRVPLPGSPVIDAGSCSGGGSFLAPEGGYSDQRDFVRPVFVPTARDRRPGDGCDLGAAEYRKADLDALGGVQVPVRWCVLRGTSATTAGGAGPDDTAIDRIASTNAVFTSQIDTTLYLRSGANVQVANVQIIDHHDSEGNVTPDVRVGSSTSAPNLSEFAALIYECRSRWADLPGGLTAVLIGRFIDDNGTPVPIAGIGGRALEGDCASQLSAGRVMVIDGGELGDPACLIDMTSPRLAKFLAHETGHALSLRHGDGSDTNTDQNIDDPEAGDELPNMSGGNLMEYGEPDGNPGTILDLLGKQTFQAKEHALECVPGAEPLGLLPLTADLKTATDDDSADPGRIKIPSFGIVLNPNATSILFAETVASPVTNSLAETSELLGAPSGTTTYLFLADLDHNEKTGGTAPGYPNPSDIRGGLEFVGKVEVVDGVVGEPQIQTLHDKQWVTQEGGKASVHDLHVGIAQLCGNFTDLDPLVGASVQLQVPDKILTEAGWIYGDQLDVQIAASVIGQVNIVPPNAKAPLLGDALDVRYPTCTVEPSTAPPEGALTVNAGSFIPNTQLDVRLNSEVLGTISTQSPGGTGSLATTIPFGTPAGHRLLEVRDPQSALQAYCVLDVVDTPLQARCRDMTVSTDAGVCNAGSASIDDGSGDPNGEPVTIVQSPAGPYPLGATTVTLTVQDSQGHSAQCTGVVTVKDDESPVISVSVSPQSIWPPNHRMVNVTATVHTRDNCGVSPEFKLASITSNEAATGREPDVQQAAFGSADMQFQLRAERNGSGSGRVYTIVYTSTDSTGHAVTGSAQVTVPHDQRR